MSASSKPALLSSLSGDIATVTMSNPNRHNALPQALWEAFPATLEKLVGDGARVIILRGAGESFCAGADISEFETARRDAETAARYEQANARAFEAIRTVAVPTIAEIRGYCLGGGFGVAAACDLRLASKDALFSVPAARLGLAYPAAAIADVVHAVGPQFAKTMLYTAARFDARTMREAGFLNEVADENTLDQRSHDLARQIASLAPLTHRATKAAIDASLGIGALNNAEALGNATFTSADYSEGRAAFREKRPPKFQGN